jgi:hypothetical protein
MGSRAVRRVSLTVPLLVALAAPGTALGQTTNESSLTFEQLAERILAEEAINGPYSAELLDPLKALSVIYEDRGNHALALGVLEKALQVVRANNGLRTLEQAPLIAQSIHNEEARGNFAAAWDLEMELVQLARRHPDDLRTVSILRDIGDKRADMLERYIDGEYPPQIVLGCFYRPPFLREGEGNCYAGSKGVAERNIATAAQKHYVEAIEVLLRNDLYESPELRDLELELLRSTYLYGGPYGRQSLRRLLSYQVATDEPWIGRMESFIEIVDWDFLYGNKGTVLNTYVQAHQLIKQNKVPQAAIDSLFAPELPIVLPTFFPNPLSSPRRADSRGFIDVSFDITKYGRSRNVRVLDTTTNATEDEQDRLVRLITRSYFRPRAVEGQIADRAPVVVRYYLNADSPIATPVDPTPRDLPPQRPVFRPFIQSG